MAKLKLIKAKSYFGGVKGGTILATAKNPVVDVPEEDAERLLSTGYFGVAEGENNTDGGEAGNGGDNEGGENLFDAEELAEMSIPELREFAKEREIDLEGLTKKADILEAISKALGGSQTMMDIQK